MAIPKRYAIRVSERLSSVFAILRAAARLVCEVYVVLVFIVDLSLFPWLSKSLGRLTMPARVSRQVVCRQGAKCMSGWFLTKGRAG